MEYELLPGEAGEFYLVLHPSLLEPGEELFPYEPLQPGYIRLITVFAKGPSKIGCRFLHVPLKDLPVSYTALSYVWGDPTIVSKVYCSASHVLGLTASAQSMLRQMVEGGTSDYFWIDLLCINQADNDEKAGQVRMMGDIFGSADHVAAWLGEPSPDSYQAIQFVLTLRKAFAGYPNLKMDGHPVTIDELCSSFSPTDWKALSDFLRRPWFQRVWVIQEVVRARMLTVFCDGRMAIDWQHLAFVLTIIKMNDRDVMVRVIPTDPQVPSFYPDGLWNTSHTYAVRHLIKNGLPVTLQSALIGCRFFKSTNPRDMIYALLGIVTDAGDAALDPDYNASVQMIFTKTTQILLTTNNSLKILHIAGIGWPRALTDLPSWVPDWTFPPRNTVFGDIAESVGYRASGNSPIAAGAGHSPTRIAFNGILVDTIAKTSAMLKAGAYDDTVTSRKGNSAEIISWLEDVSQIAQSSLDSQESGQVSDDLWRALIANQVQGKIASTGYRDLFRSFIKYHKYLAANGSRTGVEEDTIRATESFTPILSSTCGRRTFFRTSKGFLGLAPTGALEGDSVCIILGAVTPFVIRDSVQESTEVCYSLVGECYVHGLMNGEGLEIGEVQTIQLI